MNGKLIYNSMNGLIGVPHDVIRKKEITKSMSKNRRNSQNKMKTRRIN